jgi:hypothetical protein
VEEEKAEETEEAEEEKRDIIKPTQHNKDITAGPETHITNLDGLVTQENPVPTDLRTGTTLSSRLPNGFDVSNKTMSRQLQEAQAKVDCLQVERSTLALLTPHLDKTEEEYLQLLKQLH